jgi:hypothetical protein
MKVRWFISVFLLLLISCAPSKDRIYARIDYVRPVNAPPSYQVFLQVPTGTFGCSGHSFIPRREMAWITIRLPKKPVGRMRYEAARVTLTENNSPNPLILTGGYLVIDLTDGNIQIAFETSKGAYWANGTYSGPVRNDT